MNKQLQQGDVILKPVSEVPKEVKEIKDGRGIVLAEGEHTGHYHGIEASEGLALLETPDKKRYLVNNTKQTVSLKHQEHNVVPIPPGAFEVDQVHELDYFEEMERKVQD